MSKIKDVLVPDIGEFDAVEVIEVLVKSGDAVSVEDSLLTMESDKASMDVPSPFSGTVKTVKIKAGDKVSQNDLILTLVIKELETGGSFIDSLNNEWLALFTSTNTLNKLITNNTYANNSSHSEAENPADAGFSSLLDNGGKSPLCDDYVFHLLNGVYSLL